MIHLLILHGSTITTVYNVPTNDSQLKTKTKRILIQNSKQRTHHPHPTNHQTVTKMATIKIILQNLLVHQGHGKLLTPLNNPLKRTLVCDPMNTLKILYEGLLSYGKGEYTLNVNKIQLRIRTFLGNDIYK